MGCLKLSYCNENKALDVFRKNLKVVYVKRGFSEKNGLNYSTFGSLQPNRHFGTEDYDYGFNGKRMDNEVSGSSGTSYDFGARMYDSRLARFKSTDPWEKKYPWQSTYAYFKNSPTGILDWNGFGGEDDLPKSPIGFNGRPKVKISHVNDQEIFDQLLKYFSYLRDNGSSTGDLREAFDFNHYVKKNKAQKAWDGYFNDDKSTHYIDNTYNFTGQNISTIKAEAPVVDGSSVKVTVIIPASFNNNFKYSINDVFSFGEIDGFNTHGRMNLKTGKITDIPQIKLPGIAKDGGILLNTNNIILNFKNFKDRNLFNQSWLEKSDKIKPKKESPVPKIILD